VKISKVVLLLTLAANSCSAANRYICPSATGSGTGADWTNAYTSFPATLTRGDTYYIAGGSYPVTTIDTNASGELWIYIVKATAAAHGTETGWIAEYGAAPAVFAQIIIRAKDHNQVGGYISIDGVTGSGTSGYGIVVTNPDVTKVLISMPSYYMGTSGSISIHHVEVYNNATEAGPGGYGISVSEGGSNFVIAYNYIHDISCNNIVFTGQSNVQIHHNILKRNKSNALYHGQGIQASNAGSTWAIYSNWFEDIVGTAAITTTMSGALLNWDVYNNIFVQSNGVSGASQLFSTNTTGITVDGLRFVGNTTSNMKDTTAARVYLPGAVTNTVVANNLWYCSGTGCARADNTTGAGITLTNNWYSTGITTSTESNKGGDSSNPFSGTDFRLAAGSSPIGAGTAFGSPFNVDYAGTMRGSSWDIGAYQYAAPPPPSTISGSVLRGVVIQ